MRQQSWYTIVLFVAAMLVIGWLLFDYAISALLFGLGAGATFGFAISGRDKK
ncbi:MAG: hypothetical protein ABI200_04320 [Gaiellales bacterium]